MCQYANGKALNAASEILKYKESVKWPHHLALSTVDVHLTDSSFISTLAN